MKNQNSESESVSKNNCKFADDTSMNLDFVNRFESRVHNLKKPSYLNLTDFYELEHQQISHGLTSRIFLALSKSNFETVVVKMFNIKQNKYAINEFNMLALCKDRPNIIQFKDFQIYSHDNHLCIILEYASGGDLHTYVYGHNENLKNKLFGQKIIYDILNAIMQCHDLGIYHRDIKLENFFIKQDGTIILGDFAFATLDKTTQLYCGTISYLAPEILRQIYIQKLKSITLTHEAEYWSLGILFYTLFTKSAPFRGSNSQIVRQLSAGKFKPIPLTNLNEHQKYIIKSLLIKDIDHRIHPKCIMEHLKHLEKTKERELNINMI
jgi:serine/threonine protein kinase